MNYPWQLVLMLCYALGLPYRHVFKSQKCFDKKKMSLKCSGFFFSHSPIFLFPPLSPKNLYLPEITPTPFLSVTVSLCLALSHFLQNLPNPHPSTPNPTYGHRRQGQHVATFSLLQGLFYSVESYRNTKFYVYSHLTKTKFS